MDDLEDAHVVLDAIDDHARRAEQKAQDAMKSKGTRKVMGVSR